MTDRECSSVLRSQICPIHPRRGGNPLSRVSRLRERLGGCGYISREKKRRLSLPSLSSLQTRITSRPGRFDLPSRAFPEANNMLHAGLHNPLAWQRFAADKRSRTVTYVGPGDRDTACIHAYAFSRFHDR